MGSDEAGVISLFTQPFLPSLQSFSINALCVFSTKYFWLNLYFFGGGGRGDKMLLGFSLSISKMGPLLTPVLEDSVNHLRLLVIWI